MIPRVGGAEKRGRPRAPPPTAHRLAAWLSLAQALTGATAKEVRFPPSEDDVQALQDLWRRRVAELRGAGVSLLQKQRVYEHALRTNESRRGCRSDERPARRSDASFDSPRL